MDPPATSALSLTSPNGSRVALPGTGAGEALLATLVSPPLSNSSSGADTPPRGDANATKQVFSDIRRLMSFAVRRDTAPQSCRVIGYFIVASGKMVNRRCQVA